MKQNMIEIREKTPSNPDEGYKTFSIRIQNDVIVQLDHIAKESHRSRNEIACLFLKYGVENYSIVKG